MPSLSNASPLRTNKKIPKFTLSNTYLIAITIMERPKNVRNVKKDTF